MEVLRNRFRGRLGERRAAPRTAPPSRTTSAPTFRTPFRTIAVAPPASPLRQEGPTLPSLDGRVSQGGGSDGDERGLEDLVAGGLSLHDHLERQTLPLLDTARRPAPSRWALIESIEDTGYLNRAVEDIATRLGTDPAEVEAILAIIQQSEPIGVGARTLAECLALTAEGQGPLRPRHGGAGRQSRPPGAGEFAQLRRICRVDEEDLADMVSEIRRLDPKPGLIFGGEPARVVVPDVFVRPAPDGSWTVELNGDALPRVHRQPQLLRPRLARTKDPAGQELHRRGLGHSHWLTRSLEQRARTILKVASEIVRQQDSFFMYGVQHLRPLNLKMIAEAGLAARIEPSPASPRTSTWRRPRGLFEMKYFFTAAIAGSSGEAHSAEAVRFRIKQLIEAESPDDVLSDDALVNALKAQGVDIARRTVAK